MENLVRAELYRVRCRPWPVVLMAATLLFGVVSMLFAEADPSPGVGQLRLHV